MPAVRLPIVSLAVREQQYTCHGCGNCCRDFTVQLRPDDLERLEEQGWAESLGEPVTIEFRGTTYLRQREDGACIFLQDDGLCRIHAAHGFEAKPVACQLFPFTLTPVEGSVQMGVNFACQSVLESRGAELRTHIDELRRMASALPEIEPTTRPPRLTDRLRAETAEVKSLTAALDGWLRRDDIDLPVRLDGLAWIVSSLAAAKLENVRGDRFRDLLDVLVGALPVELDFHPLAPPTTRQRRMLRLAVFARTEDPRLGTIARQGRWGTTFAQLGRSRRFKSGRGRAPVIGAGWPDDTRLEAIDGIAPASGDAAAMIDDLLTRYLRATILGGRAWGAGYYAWTIVNGLQAMVLNIASVGWLARLHAAGHDRDAIDLPGVQAALGRVDRTAGRAPWLGSAAERLRLRYLAGGDGYRRLVAAYAMTG
jgi:lysine-N-methylase